MRIVNKYILFILLISICFAVNAKPRHGGPPLPYSITPPRNPVPNVVIQQVLLDANNVSSWFYNTGIFNQDLRFTNTPGLMWPKGSNKFACFTAGLSMGAYYNGELREAMCSYKGEYAPGYVDNTQGQPIAKTDSRFRIYKVTATDDPLNPPPDYAQWGNMVPFGAPYVDVNNNHQYDPGIDKPGRKDAQITLFACLTDGFPDEHKVGEGFGGGTQPLFVELHFTAWGYTSPGLEDIQFINWVVFNKGIHPWTRTYMGVTVDPDLGFPDDDYIGCDTSLNLGFVYNGDNDDCCGTNSYGPNPPSFGMDYFTSPVNFNVSPPETLGLTSFVYFTNTSTPGPSCEKDPNGEQIPAYYMLQGLKKDQSAWLVPPGGDSSYITKFTYPGDPESGNGWTEGPPGNPSGSVQNCGGITGPVVTANPVGDRRFIFNSGAENFVVRPYGVPYQGQTYYDTINIVLAQFVARGSSNLNSVTRLKQLDKIAQKIFDVNFNVVPPPPPPRVTISPRQTTEQGVCALTLSWTDLSESYLFKDTLFSPDSANSYYKFEGYEIYEIRKSAENIPDFTKPETISDLDVKCIAIFDKYDSVGVIIDTLSTHVNVGGQEQFAPFPVLPPYTLSASNFPAYNPKDTLPNGKQMCGTGIARSITLTSTNFPNEYGGITGFIYGNTYKFAVLAYGYNTHPNPSLKGQNMIRNSLVSNVITYIPQAPLAGSEFYYKNGDTITNSRRDLGVVPIIASQENLINAKYRVVFNNNPDTTYNILRSFDNFAHFTVLASNLKAQDSLRKPTDDSAKVFDGIKFRIYRIIFDPIGGYYKRNAGVLKDPTLRTDSIQTRLPGWDYNPSGNRNLEGSRFVPSSTRPWNSISMNLTYPSKTSYYGFNSSLIPEDLRKVKIQFVGYGNGQKAYRFLATDATHFLYQDMRDVPFKVFEIEPYDGTSNPRQLNCAFLEFSDGHYDSLWSPTADTLGGKEILYIFGSNYDPAPNSNYTTKNLLLQQAQFDIMYTWAPKLISPGAAFHNNDELIIYPYTVTRSEFAPGYPLFYEFESKAPIIGSTNIAAQNSDLDKITIVPNPYYGFSALETPVTGRFITFRRLPKNCTIKIYTINGDLIKTLEKNDNNSSLNWNMTNIENVPIASGIYICLIDAPGIGTKVLKAAIFTPEERIDF
jgi:hypothetical protein